LCFLFTSLKASINNIDTIYIDSTKLISLKNGNRGIKFKFYKKYDSINSRNIEGITKFKYDTISNVITPLTTQITKDEINFNIIQGLRTTKDGKIEIFATSDYPNFKAKELNSIIIDPKKNPVITKFTKRKRIGVGFYGGLGISNSSLNVNVGPQVGFGVMYIVF